MREITVTEVDVGCDACSAERETHNPATAFICGVMVGLTKDHASFCSRHYAGFQHAMTALSKAALLTKRQESR